ncbi:glycoside hydrolase superfamily [Dactylonectria macrodidyma]|uniref:chitinase n=1 Tax=Dactylonectria macrodidyma TaxID=307937 RepID=A0A9P9JGX6_9HYPO|nr:glycoside hydrolase superfamily [Dactylonectria macrodidyma]
MGPRSGCQSLVCVFSLLLAASSSVFAADVSSTSDDPIESVNLASPLDYGCPLPCQEVGSDPAGWTQVHSWGELSACSQQVLFALNVQNSPSEFATIQTCKTSGSATRREVASPVEARDAAGTSVTIANNCGAVASTVKAATTFGTAGVLKSGKDVAAGASLLSEYLVEDATCGPTVLFAKSGTAVVGIYVGSEVQKTSAADLINQSRCDSTDKTTQTVGLFAVDAVNSLGQVQKALKAWASGNCVEVTGSTSNVDLGVLVAPKVAKRDVELRSRMTSHHDLLFARADCKTQTVVSGDSCASLAKRCGITAANFNKYNTGTNFCSKLVPGQKVCCSAGTLPSKKPKPYADGTCYSYSIKSGDSCYSLGQAYDLTETNIRTFNRNTWLWAGCDRLNLGQRICLSTGRPPLPLPVTGAVCGPLKPGTAKPAGYKTGWDFVGLNPCPLNACCSGFGFCGITKEFCTNTTAKGAGPGSYKAGTAGCVSNCGNKITGNTAKPAKFLNVGYFQGYNQGRPCLNMDASKLSTLTAVTHMHFAFATLTSKYEVTLAADVQDQFTKFVAMTGPWKKIISLGGWADSTDAATFQRYRYAMKAANREKFASSVLAFLTKYKLHGVDFDWEYPGSAASAGASESNEDTANYLAFLTLMRKKIGTSGKTMSAALPAAFWYLKPFPVAKMAPLLDYIIYMTYDLHGQWDYGNQYASPGCPTGNCLRSHVNKTETIDALAMITKAGVPASKVIVGVSSYGRSFKMANPKCTGPTCLFTGSFSVSDAEPGQCTLTSGYMSNAEIGKIKENAAKGVAGTSATAWYDAVSDSDLMTFGTKGAGQTDWIAYMGQSTKTKRIAWAKSLNFGGTIDWAVDLTKFY